MNALKTIIAIAILAASSVASAENLWVVPDESDSGARFAIDVDSIMFGMTKDDGPWVFAKVRLARANGQTATFVYGTAVESCDNNGGKMLSTIGGQTDTMLWRKGGAKMYDSVMFHICDWMRVIVEKGGEEEVVRRTIRKSRDGTMTPPPSLNPKVGA